MSANPLFIGAETASTVQRLDIRPVAPRKADPEYVPTPVEEATISRIVQSVVSDSHEKLLTVIPGAVRQATDEAIQTIMSVIPQGARQLAAAAVQAAMTESYDRNVGTLRIVAKLLAVRFILLLAVLGGFALAVMVLRDPTVIGAAILGGYVVSTIWPLVWLFGKSPKIPDSTK